MRVLVTGANGFVGGYMISSLAERGHVPIISARSLKAPINLGLETVYLDLLDEESIHTALREARPDAIIHLAAQSRVGAAWDHPAETVETNLVGTLHLLEAVKAICPETKIIAAGSGEEYGLTGKSGETLTEEHPCAPQNPYAVSKWAAGQTALQIARRESIAYIHVRAFNHFGPRQPEGFVVSDLAAQIARMEKQLCPPVMKVGNLSAQRDFTSVLDVVQAYLHLLEHEVPSGVYNVCSGRARPVQDILDRLIAMANVRIEVAVDPARLRPSDIQLFVGSYEKINRATGWKPSISWEESIFRTLEWWREQAITNHESVGAEP